MFRNLVEIGGNEIRIKVGCQKWLLEWTDIVGANKLFGFIFLRTGEAIILSRDGHVKVHDYETRDIGEGEFSVHLGWTMFVGILEKNVVAPGGKFIDEFEGLYNSFMMALPGFSHWKCKLSPEEAKERKVLIIYLCVTVFLLLTFIITQIFVFGEKEMSDAWGLLFFISMFCIFAFGFGFFIYYLRMGKVFKILERHNVPIKRD